MKHSNRRILSSILIITIPFTSLIVSAATPPHHEGHLDSSQLKIEIAASQQRATLELEQSTQALKQQVEAYTQAKEEWFELYHARQLEMSKDLKELLRREGL